LLQNLPLFPPLEKNKTPLIRVDDSNPDHKTESATGGLVTKPQDHLKHVGFEAPVANATLPKLPEAPKVMVGSPPPDGYRAQETSGYEHILPNIPNAKFGKIIIPQNVPFKREDMLVF